MSTVWVGAGGGAGGRLAQVALGSPPTIMENQLWYDNSGYSNEYQAGCQDAEETLFVLLGLIILVNISINITTVVSDGWRPPLGAERAVCESWP